MISTMIQLCMITAIMTVLLGVELDDQLLLDLRVDRGAGGSEWIRIFIWLGMASSHAGTPRVPASARDDERR